MFDAITEESMISPTRVALNATRCANRRYEEPSSGVNEGRRRTKVAVAAGRIVWLCQQDGDRWRGMSRTELLESQRADVQAYRDEMDRLEQEVAVSAKKKSKSLGYRLSRMAGLARGPVLVPPPKARPVPFISHTDEQLLRGLELLVEQGRLRTETIGDETFYFVEKAFFDGLDINPAQEEITEP